MALTLGTIMTGAGIRDDEALAIRHVFIPLHSDSGESGISADSTDEQILDYTARQSTDPRKFPRTPPRFWMVFIREDGGQARLWKVVENRGEISNDGVLRTFGLTESALMKDMAGRLVVRWRSPRTWRLNGTTVAGYPVESIADAEPIPFPGFDRLILDYPALQAVMREPRYASWRTALGSVMGVYLITDTRSGRHYVGKAGGAENIRQRWDAYATTGHGGNKELRPLDPEAFQFSLLRVFDPSTPVSVIDMSESHFKRALDTRRHGLNAN